MEGITNDGFIVGMTVLAAALAMLPAATSGLAQGLATGKAVEAVGRQPEAGGEVRSTLIMGLALTETSGIYGLIVAMSLIFANPFIG